MVSRGCLARSKEGDYIPLNAMKLLYTGIIELKPYGHSPPCLFLGTPNPLIANIRTHAIHWSATDISAAYRIGTGQPVRVSGKCLVNCQLRYMLALSNSGGVAWDEVLLIEGQDLVPVLRQHVGVACLMRLELIRR